MSSVELIPGTTLPLHVGPGGEQTEGRGEIEFNPERGPVSLLEKMSEQLTPAEIQFVSAALRSFGRQPRLERTVSDHAARQTDATTGNVVIPFFLTPAGYEARLTSLTVDCPNQSTINPSAPFANASSWQFIAKLPSGTTGVTAAQADTLRTGLVAFAPVSAAGPIIPGQWTFNSDQAPVGRGGDQFYYVLHGGSIAGILNLALQVTYRIDLYSFE